MSIDASRGSTLLATTLAAAVAELPEPTAADPQRALRLLEPIVSVLAGFALGTIADGVVLAVRRRLGFAAASAVRAELAARWPTGAPAASAGARPVRYLAADDAAARPLVDELATRLHARLALAAPELRALAAIATAAIARVAPAAGTGAVADALAETIDDDLLRDRIAGEIALGWDMYRAALASTPPPSTAARSQRSQALWAAWTSRRTPTRPAIDPAAVTRAGYILQVG